VVPVLFAKLGRAVPEAFIGDCEKLMGGGDFRVMTAAGPLFADPLRGVGHGRRAETSPAALAVAKAAEPATPRRRRARSKRYSA
jgi:hypothetical protein